MQATGPYRWTAAFSEAYTKGDVDMSRVLFFSQPIVMRAQCGLNDGGEECKTMKRLRLKGDRYVERLGLTTAHYASEQWMDWREDRKRLRLFLNNTA